MIGSHGIHFNAIGWSQHCNTSLHSFFCSFYSFPFVLFSHLFTLSILQVIVQFFVYNTVTVLPLLLSSPSKTVQTKHIRLCAHSNRLSMTVAHLQNRCKGSGRPWYKKSAVSLVSTTRNHFLPLQARAQSTMRALPLPTPHEPTRTPDSLITLYILLHKQLLIQSVYICMLSHE